MRHVQDAQFSGPLELLLQLIEREEMDISQVSLGKITDQYIAELQQMEELPVDELADFLVVAAKLLLIKSRLLIPGETPIDDAGVELERQLRMYKAFVDATKHIIKLYNRHRVVYPREGYALLEPMFNPPTEMRPDDLRNMFADVLKELEPITRLPQTVIVRTMNIRQKIQQITERLLNDKTTNFHDLLKQAKNKTEVIITFLAMLEMVKLRTAAVVQDTLYANVTVTALDPEPELKELDLVV